VALEQLRVPTLVVHADSAPLISPDGIPFALVPSSVGRELYRSALRTIAV
jgi:predicted alpha/beta-fold hydrolase